MATPYYLMNNKQTALAQSESFWNKVLGRAKFPQDTTQFLFAIMTNPQNDQSMLVVDETGYNALYPLLTPQEQNVVNNNLVPESDPRVQAIIASQPQPGP